MKLPLILAALSLCLAFDASAGGLRARIQGPGADGVTYTARTSDLDANAVLEPWALAEGVVDGRRVSRLIRLTPAGEPGSYTFARTWPVDGRWMIRFCPGNPQAPATVVTLREDGTVKKNQFYFRTDGMKECQKALRKWQTVESDC